MAGVALPNLGDGINPDQLVIIDTGEASALLLIEVDESTERPPVIRERLNAYAKMFAVRHAGWYLLWVVNSPARLARLRQIAAPMEIANLTNRCWGVPIGEVSKLGASAQAVSIGESLPPRSLRSLATDPKARRTPYPVGSEAWIQLLADAESRTSTTSGTAWIGSPRTTQTDLAFRTVNVIHFSSRVPILLVVLWGG